MMGFFCCPGASAHSLINTIGNGIRNKKIFRSDSYGLCSKTGRKIKRSINDLNWKLMLGFAFNWGPKDKGLKKGTAPVKEFDEGS